MHGVRGKPGHLNLTLFGLEPETGTRNRETRTEEVKKKIDARRVDGIKRFLTSSVPVLAERGKQTRARFRQL
jgi:hypothetical protein